MIYETPKEGAWVQPIRKGYKFVCCDCGLVHRMDFRIYRGWAQFRAWRHARATAAHRHWRAVRGEPKLVSAQPPEER